MTKEPHNDVRADHEVHVFPDATNVKFKHNNYVISLAAYGQETIIFDNQGNFVWETAGTSAAAVSRCVQYIDSME